MQSAGERIAGVPNTLPLHGIEQGVLSLAASDVSYRRGRRLDAELPPEARYKTSFYSMLGGVGQTVSGWSGFRLVWRRMPSPAGFDGDCPGSPRSGAVLKMKCTSRFVVVCGMVSFAPSGLTRLLFLYPRLTPWAIFSRRSAALYRQYSCLLPLRPERPVQRPVLDGFGDVFGRRSPGRLPGRRRCGPPLGFGRGRGRSCRAGSWRVPAGVRSRRKAHRRPNMAGSHLGIAVEPRARRCEPLHLDLPGPHAPARESWPSFPARFRLSVLCSSPRAHQYGYRCGRAAGPEIFPM